MNCDLLAPWYRWLEYGALGRALERRREAFLAQLDDARHALLLGDGDGRFAAALLQRNRAVQIVSVEGSAEMLRCARGRVEAEIAASDRVQFVHADARAWLQLQSGSADATERCDLVVTHFFLDCFSASELAEIIPKIAARLTPEACWLVSEFRQPAGYGWRAWHAWIWLRVLYFFFRLTTGLRVTRLTDHRPLLAAQGFVLAAEQTARAGLLASELWQRRREPNAAAGGVETTRA